MYKYICTILVSLSFFSVNNLYAETKTVTLRAGTPVLLALKENVTGKGSNIGDIVKFMVIRPVKVDDVVVINVNTEAIGKIADIKKAKGWGRKGDISLNVNSATAVDGTEVLLSAFQKREGDGHVGGATTAGVVGGLICLPIAPVGFLIKGEDGSFPIGYEVKAYTDMDVKIKVDTSTTSNIPVNIVPLANAGTDQSVKAGALVTLDGSKSSDPDGDKLTFKWAFKSKPHDSTANLNDYTSVKPTFTADVTGTYVLNLIVNDGTVDSEPSTCTIKVEPSESSISQ